MSRPRVALIGCGFFARNHVAAWAALGAQVVGVCDRDQTRADAYAAEFGAPAYTDAAAMLAALKPDIADIATTVESHLPLVELAATHARVVICQKPFAETLPDARAMVAACDATGATLMVHENFRWQRPFRTLAALLAEGRLGTPRFLRLSFRHAFDIYANQPYLAQVPDLALTDVGLHLFDMARAAMGDVTRVACATQRLNPRVTGQDAFQALLTHDSGAISSVECSFHSTYAPDRFPQTLAVVEGTLGSAELLADCRIRLHRDGGTEEIDADPTVPAWSARPWHMIAESVQAFQSHALDVLAGRDTPRPSGADNLRTLAVTLAAIRAAAQGTTEQPERV